MSKRAPSGDAVPVRRATQPSTASRTSATTASATSAGTGVGPAERVGGQRGHAADERGPGQRHPVGRPQPVGAGAGEAARPAPRSVTTPQATPTTQPAPLSPTVAGERGEQRQLGDQPDHRAGSNRAHRASVSVGYIGNTRNATVRFISGPGEGEAGAE